MRTTVNIPDELIPSLMKYTQAHSCTEAIDRALDDWLKIKKREKLKKLRGKLNYEGDLDKLRKLEIKKHI